jgi:hypothetical protein
LLKPLTIYQGFYEDGQSKIEPKREMIVSIRGASSVRSDGKVSIKRMNLRGIEILYPRELYGGSYKTDIDDPDEIYKLWAIRPVSSKHFSQPGDSGAWVLHDHSELVGMLLGLSTRVDDSTSESIFTSWSSVLGSIEANPRVRSLALQGAETGNILNARPGSEKRPLEKSADQVGAKRQRIRDEQL